MMTPSQVALLEEIQKFARSAPDSQSLMERISRYLHENLARYNWVGFYLVDKSTPRTLVLGPHVGSFTPLERISFEQGLCGAAAASGKTVVVNQVAEDARYLAGSDLVKSEIVSPVFAKGVLVGEIDINSYFAGTFTAEEQEFVETCATLVGRYCEKRR
jgi:putative methionine-R-sulfoxide reductase with GAF domain